MIAQDRSVVAADTDGIVCAVAADLSSCPAIDTDTGFAR